MALLLLLSIICCTTGLNLTQPLKEPHWKPYYDNAWALVRSPILNFTDAQEYCQLFNASLPSIHSKDEQKLLLSLFPRFTYSAWIGAKRIAPGNSITSPVEAQFEFIDGTPMDIIPQYYQPDFASCFPISGNGCCTRARNCLFLSNKFSTQPSNTNDEQDCVAMQQFRSRGVGGWNDLRCRRQFPFFCKRHLPEGQSAPTATTTTTTTATTTTATTRQLLFGGIRRTTTSATSTPYMATFQPGFSSWISISPANSFAVQTDAFYDIMLPTQFHYAGVDCDQIRIFVNGFLELIPVNGQPVDFSQFQLISPLDLAPWARIVSPFGVPLTGSQIGSPYISHDFIDQRIIVEWRDVARVDAYSEFEQVTFQVHLNVETGAISFLYEKIIAGTSPFFPTIGLRWGDGEFYANRYLPLGMSDWSTTTAGESPYDTVAFNPGTLPLLSFSFTWTLVDASETQYKSSSTTTMNPTDTVTTGPLTSYLPHFVFTQSFGTYTPLTTGYLYPMQDDAFYDVLIGPGLVIAGVPCEKFRISTNGFVEVASSNSPFRTTTETFSPLSQPRSAESNLVIAPFGADLIATLQGESNVRWALIDPEIIVQWQDVRRYFAHPDERISFQIRINIYTRTISFVYGGKIVGKYAALSSTSPEVGLRRSAVDFANRQTTYNQDSWLTTSAGLSIYAKCSVSPSQVPTVGLKFTWTPSTTSGISTTALPTITTPPVPSMKLSMFYFMQAVNAFTPLTLDGDMFSIMDDDIYDVLLPFAFPFSGKNLEKMRISSNGFVELVPLANSFSTTRTQYFPMSEQRSAVSNLVISPFGMDLQAASSGHPLILLDTIGPEIVVQWQDVRRYFVAGERINFQLRLNTSTGDIVFVYGDSNFNVSSNNGGGGFPEIGLRRQENNFKEFTTRQVDFSSLNGWGASYSAMYAAAKCYLYSGLVPDNGLTYSWLVHAPPTTTSSTTTAPASTTMTGVAGSATTMPAFSSTTTSNQESTSTIFSSTTPQSVQTPTVNPTITPTPDLSGTIFETYLLTLNFLSYEPLSTGVTFEMSDDAIYDVTLPNAISLGGIACSEMRISSNGFIELVPVASVFLTNQALYTPLSTARQSAMEGITISAFGVDLYPAVEVGQASVMFDMVGSELVVQWTNVRRYSYAGEHVNFQIRIDNSTGTVSFVYGGGMAPGESINKPQPQVGMRHGENDFVIAEVTGSASSWLEATQEISLESVCTYGDGVFIPEGLAFVWSYPENVPVTNSFSFAMSTTTEALPVNAVLPTYTFTQTYGSFNLISEADGVTAIDMTDDAAFDLSLEPPLSFANVLFDRLRISTNGILELIPTTMPANSYRTTAQMYTPFRDFPGGRKTLIIAPFATDLDAQLAPLTSKISVGSVDFELVVQWENVRRFDTAGEIVTFQVRINNATGAITFAYGETINPGVNPLGSFRDPEVGLAFSRSDFAVREVLAFGNWDSSTAGQTSSVQCSFEPGTQLQPGLMYTWTPA